MVKQRTVFHRLHKQRRQTLWMPCMSEDSPRWKTFSKGGLCSPHSPTNMENHELTQCSLSTKITAFPGPSNLNLQTVLYCYFTSVKVHVLILLIVSFFTFLRSCRPFSLDIGSRYHNRRNYCTNYSLGTLTTHMPLLQLNAKCAKRQDMPYNLELFGNY